jgi:hypothetical protein
MHSLLWGRLRSDAREVTVAQIAHGGDVVLLGGLGVERHGLGWIGLHARTHFITQAQIAQSGKIAGLDGLAEEVHGLDHIRFHPVPVPVAAAQNADGPGKVLGGGPLQPAAAWTGSASTPMPLR